MLYNGLKLAAHREPKVLEAMHSFGMDFEQTDCLDPNLGFERIPHVTLDHPSRTSQRMMHQKYDPSQHKSVLVSVTGILWTVRNAALSVEVPLETVDGTNLPEGTNDFVHITLWRKGVKAVESKFLPSLVSENMASQVIFQTPFVINGTVSYWDP